MTGKADRNLVYRQALKDTGDEEPESLNTILAIIGITVPVVGGMYYIKKCNYSTLLINVTKRERKLVDTDNFVISNLW